MVACEVCLLPWGSSRGGITVCEAYHQVSDICINEVLLNPDANVALLKMNRPLVSFCDYVARMAMGQFSDQEYSIVLRGELPSSAMPNWRRSRDILFACRDGRLAWGTQKLGIKHG